MTAYPKMANIANILPSLVIFCKEITKHFGCDIFWVFYIQKTYFYVIAVAEISVGLGCGRPPPPPPFVENDEFSEILTYKRAKKSFFECKWGGEGLSGNLKVLSQI
jgi:hypothetical protein